jgi:hypothetical protein
MLSLKIVADGEIGLNSSLSGQGEKDIFRLNVASRSVSQWSEH